MMTFYTYPESTPTRDGLPRNRGASRTYTGCRYIDKDRSRAFRALIRQLDAEVNAGNLDGVMAFYADDAVQMPPDTPIFIGKEALHSGFEGFLAANTVELSSTVEDIRVSGDLAFLRLSYTQSVTPKDGGDTTTEVGKWVLLLARQVDGSWRITTEIWNSDAASN